MSKFVSGDNNFVDETILGTPLPEATSTVNNNGDRYMSMMSAPSDQKLKRGSSSRLTGTIENLKSFSEALASVRRTPDGEEHSLLSVTDSSFGPSIPSKASLGVLDIDALLGNEVLDNSQDIMEQLYKSQQRKKSPAKVLGKKESCGGSVQGLRQAIQKPVPSKFCSEAPRIEEKDQSALGVPSFLLQADNTMSDADSFSEASSVGLSKGSYLSEASEEVAAIMGKDNNSSFDSGRISFEPCEVSARSTSLGVSNSGSKLSDSSSQSISWHNVENADVDEVFISDNDKMMKQLERDEQSFIADYLPPINPDMIPDSNSSRLSNFSEVHDGEKIMVRPSWIGLEGGSDDPINISVGEYFRMKTDVLPNSSGYLTPDMRPNLGMKITSPRRKEKGIPLVSDSFDEFSPKTPRQPSKSLNTTQVVTPKESSLCSSINNIDNSEASPDEVNLPNVSIPSLSCIDKILQEIDSKDSPNTMANKFLRYSSPSCLREMNNNTEGKLPGASPKNNLIEQNLNDNVRLKEQKKSGLQTPKILLSKSSKPRTGDGVNLTQSRLTRPKETKGVKCQIPDLLNKLNSLERRGQNDKSVLKNLSNIVDKLRSNVAGPLDCSAMYETLNSDVVMEGPLDFETSVNISTLGREPLIAQESSGGKSWIEVPEEILYTGDHSELPQQLCVGLGFSAFIPLVNLTNNWLMYEVSPLKNLSDGEIIFQQLPIRTLLAPSSHAEFEVVVAPMRAGKHSIELEIKVTNFMAEGEVPNQIYCTKLTLNSNIPKVLLISDGMNKLREKETLNFGVLPEQCTRKMSLHLLNAGKTDIPVRMVIEEMPEACKPFAICSASRFPEKNDNMLSNVDLDKLYHSGINFVRKDLLSVDLRGSGPNSMVTVGLCFRPPSVGLKSLKVGEEMSQFTARLRVELDVPLNCSSEYTLLKEVFLSGSVGITKLEVGLESDILILHSREKNVISQSTSGRGAIPKHLQNSPTIYPPVTQLIPICNQGTVPLHLSLCILLSNGENAEDDDNEMTVVPDSLSLKPGERSSLNVTYQPDLTRTDLAYECNRILALKLNPNGPAMSYNLKGVCVPVKCRNSLPNDDDSRAAHPPDSRLGKVISSSDSMPQIIQATRTILVWGCAPLNTEYWKSSFMLRNPTSVLEKVSLAISGSENYKLLNDESEVVRKTSFDLPPKQSQLVRVFFRPKKLGPSVGKIELTIFDGREAGRKIASKMMSLYGYGGCCKIEVIALPKDMAGRPWLNLGLILSHPFGTGALDFGTPIKANTSRSASPSQSAPSLKSRLLLHNAGTLTAFVKIIPLKVGTDPDSLANLEEGREHFVTVRPDTFQLDPLTGINVWVSYVHGVSGQPTANESTREPSQKGERVLEQVAKLLILSGEVVTRARLRKIYKTAEIIHVNKDIGQFLTLNGVSLSFIGVESKEGVVTELEDSPENDEGENLVSSLCDPATKDAVQSLMQNMKSVEVMLAVEREVGVKGLESDPNATLAVQNAANEVFHPLMDDRDASPCIIRNYSFFNPETVLGNRESGGRIWSIEPEGTVSLGLSHGASSNLVLRNYTGDEIIFETRLGLVEPDGSMKWIPPPYRQTHTGSSLLMVEPWQGQLPPFGSLQLKLFLQRDSNCPLLNGILQVCSENDSLKVKIKIKGNFMPERYHEGLNDKSVVNRAFIKKNSTSGYAVKHKTGGENPVLVRKELTNSEVPLSQNQNDVRRKSLYVETSTLKFPVTSVGSLSYEKLILKNPTSEHFKVHILPVSEPFAAPSEVRNLRDNFYLAIKVGFCPRIPGSFEQTIKLKVASLMSSKTQDISVTLQARSVL